MENILSHFRFVLVGASMLLVLATAGCTPSSVPVPATTTPTSTPTLSSSPTPAPTASPTPAPTPSQYTVNIASKALIGNYLVNGKGMALYYTTSDRPQYSNLPDETLSVWPPFYVSSILVPPSLNASDFGTYTRDNNVKQTTYKGYPLYYFFQDKAAGDTLGNKLGGVWFVVNPDNLPPSTRRITNRE